MSQSNRIIRFCNRCIRREREKFDPKIHEQCMRIRLTKWQCEYYQCKIQDKFRIGRHTYPIDVIEYQENKVGELYQFRGKCIWQKNTPKEGKPALLPLYLVRYDSEAQTFSKESEVLTDKETGKFLIEIPYQEGEFYLSFKLDEIKISRCRKQGMVTGHECQLCFQHNKEVTEKFSHQIRCRKANIVEEYSFEFVQNKNTYSNINPILNV